MLMMSQSLLSALGINQSTKQSLCPHGAFILIGDTQRISHVWFIQGEKSTVKKIKTEWEHGSNWIRCSKKAFLIHALTESESQASMATCGLRILRKGNSSYKGPEAGALCT
jgi:hypothetical protein